MPGQSVARSTVAVVILALGIGQFANFVPAYSAPSLAAFAPVVEPLQDGGGKPQAGDSVLEVSIVDPAHPDQPWIVTTFRRDDESIPAFVRRHRDTVDAVRSALGY